MKDVDWQALEALLLEQFAILASMKPSAQAVANHERKQDRGWAVLRIARNCAASRPCRTRRTRPSLPLRLPQCRPALRQEGADLADTGAMDDLYPRLQELDFAVQWFGDLKQFLGDTLARVA